MTTQSTIYAIVVTGIIIAIGGNVAVAQESAVVVEWPGTVKTDMLAAIDSEIQTTRTNAGINHGWVTFFVVVGILINAAVAIATASANSSSAFMKNWQPWFLYGAAILSIVAGITTAIPAATNMNEHRAGYTQGLYSLKILRVHVSTGTISPKAAAEEYKQILRNMSHATSESDG